jgi:phosphoglycerol transferase MdoB-like AlkP superfamily enzyme
MNASIRYNSILSLLKQVGTLLLLYTCCRILFYVFNYSYFSDLAFGSFIYLLFAGLRFDLSIIVLSNSLFLLLYLFPTRFREKKGYRIFLRSLFILVNSIAMLANCIDFSYFRFTLKRTTADALHFFDGKIGNDLGTLLPVFLKDYWYIFLLWILLTGLLIFLYNRIEKKRLALAWTQKEFSREKNIFILFIPIAIVAYRGGVQLKPISAIDAGEYTSVKYVPLVTSTPFTIIKTLDVPAIQPVIYFSDEQEMKRLYNPVKEPRATDLKKKNVFIIILESFSKEYVGALNNRRRGYTPFLDSLIKESLTFTNAYANAKRSIEGIPAVVAGIPSWMYEPYITSTYGSNQINSLPNLLKAQGYYSAFFHGGTNGTMGFDAFASLAGYDNYYGRKEYNNEKDFDGNWGIWDEEFLQYTLKTISEKQQPFLATVFTLSSHHPYTIPAKHAGKFESGILPIHISVRYTDYALRQFFESAKKTTWFANTLFVLVADHTSISEDPFYTNKVGNNAIPIIFYSGDRSLKSMDSTVMQQIDIMPSVLDYLHYPAAYFGFGNSVFDSTQSHYAFSYSSDGDAYQLIEHNYSFGFNGQKAIELYNLSKDSLLQTNLIDTDTTSIKHQMEQKTKAIIQTYQQALINNKMYVNPSTKKD